jgi:hypothetical protein
MVRYAAPKLPKWKTDAVEQGWFDFLVPYRSPLISPVQVAKSLGKDVDHVYSLCQRGKLEDHGVPGRKVQRRKITKRSLLLYMAESANYSPADIVDRAVDVAVTFTDAQLALFQQKIKAARIKV